MIQQNIEIIRQNIAKACEKSGRNPEDVTIVAITKNVSPDKIRQAIACGIMDFGESYVQEAREKIPAIADKATWHFVGHLQKNKVKDVVPYFEFIHSADNFPLLEKIDLKAQGSGKIQNVLIQVNLAKEESKFGLEEAEVFDMVKSSENLKNIKLSGLMIIPPYEENPEKNRIYFKKLADLAKKITDRGAVPAPLLLSMGMSGDYEIAVEEGANMVRIGTAIFGERK